LGLALDEPNDEFTTYQSNNIDVGIHPQLDEQLKPLGGVVIDYIDNGPQQRGFTVSTKSKPDGMDCSSCGTGSSTCGDEEQH
jgi:hypothetical protein